MAIYLTDHFGFDKIESKFPSYFLRVRKVHIDYVKHLIKKRGVIVSIKDKELLYDLAFLLKFNYKENIENYKLVSGDIVIVPFPEGGTHFLAIEFFEYI